MNPLADVIVEEILRRVLGKILVHDGDVDVIYDLPRQVLARAVTNALPWPVRFYPVHAGPFHQ